MKISLQATALISICVTFHVPWPRCISPEILSGAGLERATRCDANTLDLYCIEWDPAAVYIGYIHGFTPNRESRCEAFVISETFSFRTTLGSGEENFFLVTPKGMLLSECIAQGMTILRLLVQ